jgi:hypothetical protein
MNSTLTVLDLWANNISDEGAQILAEGLKRNRWSHCTLIHSTHLNQPMH